MIRVPDWLLEQLRERQRRAGTPRPCHGCGSDRGIACPRYLYAAVRRGSVLIDVDQGVVVWPDIVFPLVPIEAIEMANHLAEGLNRGIISPDDPSLRADIIDDLRLDAPGWQVGNPDAAMTDWLDRATHPEAPHLTRET